MTMRRVVWPGSPMMLRNSSGVTEAGGAGEGLLDGVGVLGELGVGRDHVRKGGSRWREGPSCAVRQSPTHARNGKR